MTSSLAHISEKPWSSYSQSDYDISQWHRACLIHNHTGTPTSKSECKVPVKTPDGTLSRSGVHAAAAALAGARGGVQASAEQMASAKTALRGLYSQLNETPPDSLQHSNVDFYTEAIEDFLSHHGVRGMHWGVRRSHPGPGGSTGPGRKTVKKQKRLDKVVAKRSQREKQINQLNKTLNDIHKNGLQSNHMQTKYGKDLARKDITFGLMYGMSKRDLLKLERDNLENERDFQTSLLKRNDKKIKKLNDNLAGVQHDAMDEDDDLDEFDDIEEFEDLDEIEHFGLNDFIEHTGVKGMHWGVRKDVQRLRDVGAKSRSMGLVQPGRREARKVAKADKKFEKKNTGLKVFIQVHNRAAELSNAHDIDRINNKPEYKGKDLSTDTPLSRKYLAEHQKAYLDNVYKAAAEIGTNASGTRRLSIKTNADGDWYTEVTDVKHDVFDDLAGSIIHVFYDSMGHITRVEPSNDMQQSDLTVDEFLEHYGVRGMHWGQRRDGGKGGGKSSSTSTSHPTHDDFARATDLHSRAKSHGTKVLSNKEMKDVIDRMNLEQQYSKLAVGESGGSKAVKVGRDFGKGVLKNVGQQAASEILKGHLMAQLTKAGLTAGKATVKPSNQLKLF